MDHRIIGDDPFDRFAHRAQMHWDVRCVDHEGVERLKAHTGAIIPSPFFGPMSKDECVGLQLVHCAHHLSFLVPKGG
jgi:hypothetical protein